ncbi:hypothetical protein U1Q18_019529 [Sarracenia purpurea var. burkii]
MDFPRVAHVPLLRRRDQIDEAEAREAAEDGDDGGSTSVVERFVLENQKENGLFRSRAFGKWVMQDHCRGVAAASCARSV